jgi:hypothetical protein
MWEVERSILIKAPPLRVWTALADFDGFKRWHPFIRLAGAGVEGAKLDYTFFTSWTRKPLTARATLTRFRKPETIGWLAGLRGILLIEEIYEIGVVSAGTEVRHRMLWRGLLGRMPLVNTRPRLLNFMEESDAALERHLRHAATTSRPLSRNDWRAGKRRAR